MAEPQLASPPRVLGDTEPPQNGQRVFLSMKDLAERWGVSEEAVKKLRKQGKLPNSHPLPLRVVRWHISQIEQLENSMRTNNRGRPRVSYV